MISELYDRMERDEVDEGAGVGVGGYLNGFLVARDGFISPQHVFVRVPHITARINHTKTHEDKHTYRI